MGDIAEQADGQALDRPLARRMVIRSSRALGRVLVRTVAGIDDRAFDMLGQQVGRAGRGVADDQDVGPHRLDVPGRVDERLTLREAGAARARSPGCRPRAAWPPG